MSRMLQQVIYVTAEQKARLQAAAKKRGAAEAQLVREALEKYLGENLPPAVGVFDGIFGLWKDRTDIGSGVEHERKLRQEWETWSKRVWKGRRPAGRE